MNRSVRAIFALTLLLPLCAPCWSQDQAASRPATPSPFSADAYIAHVKYLASDELGGRGTGSEGGEKAAAYIAQQFEAAGCQPAGDDGTWFQAFDVRQGKRLLEEEAALEVSGLERRCELRKDWITFPFSELEDVEGPLAFAGYGIQAEQYGYDDYAGFDAQGKILLVFRYEPRSDDPQAEFGGEDPSRHAFFFRKARTAKRHGARGLLVVNPPGRDPEHDELYRFDSFNSDQTYALPMAHITRELAQAILKQAGMPDLKTLQETLDKERKPLSRDLGLTVRLRPGIRPNTVVARNVIGLLRGDGSTEEAIVVGGHRDHLGTQPADQPGQPPVIYNGADDNASGTAGVIELARVVGRAPKLRRNIYFVAFDAEEMGLLGSQYFLEHPPTALENIKAMINLDMIGRLKQDQFMMIGVPLAREFPELVQKAAAAVEVKYKSARDFAGGGSDHGPFIDRKIPALFIFTGLHKEYHKPEDDWELIDADGAARILQMTHTILVELANMEQGPTYTEAPPEPAQPEEQLPKPAVDEAKEGAEEGEAAAAPHAGDEPPSRSNLRVALGVMPDLAGDDRPGLRVQHVREGGAAKAAGMLDGDRIIRIGGEEIRDIYAYMRSMGEHKPGDVVEVVVVRDGREVTLKVTLQASDYGRQRPRD